MLRVFQNGLLRKIFGPKRGEVTGEWRRLQPEELYGSYFPPDVTRVMNSRMGWAGHVVRTGTTIPAFEVLGGTWRKLSICKT